MLRVLYIAKHGQETSNDDEGAIRHSLQDVLGHNVVRYNESLAMKASRNPHEFDFILIHKLANFPAIEALRAKKTNVPIVFWYFDLVDFPDPTLRHRNWNRISWMNTVIPAVAHGFCTDGDWVLNTPSPKLSVLRQGADERFAGPGQADGYSHDILFAGNRHGGTDRESFCQELEDVYGRRYREVSHGVHQRKLADMIANSKIVVAPDSPVTDRYWSNRVYLCLGFQAFMIHPYSKGLAEDYEEDKEIVFFRSRVDLHEKINYYLHPANEAERLAIAKAGFDRTMRDHTYTKRCEQLVAFLEQKGIVPCQSQSTI